MLYVLGGLRFMGPSSYRRAKALLLLTDVWVLSGHVICSLVAQHGSVVAVPSFRRLVHYLRLFATTVACLIGHLCLGQFCDRA